MLDEGYIMADLSKFLRKALERPAKNIQQCHNRNSKLRNLSITRRVKPIQNRQKSSLSYYYAYELTKNKKLT